MSHRLSQTIPCDNTPLDRGECDQRDPLSYHTASIYITIGAKVIELQYPQSIAPSHLLLSYQFIGPTSDRTSDKTLSYYWEVSMDHSGTYLTFQHHSCEWWQPFHKKNRTLITAVPCRGRENNYHRYSIWRTTRPVLSYDHIVPQIVPLKRVLGSGAYTHRKSTTS